MEFQKPVVSIIGGTGKIGSALIKALIQEGYDLRLLVRNINKLKIKSNSITVINGDARDPDSIAALVKGSNVLINTIGQPKGEQPLFSKVAENILQALPKYDVKRYIVIAGLGLETPNDRKRFITNLLTKTMHFLFPKIMNDKKAEYKLITGSNLNWTIIRIPRVLLTAEKKVLKANEYDCLGMTINSAGLISFIINQISDSTFYRKAPFISN